MTKVPSKPSGKFEGEVGATPHRKQGRRQTKNHRSIPSISADPSTTAP